MLNSPLHFVPLGKPTSSYLLHTIPWYKALYGNVEFNPIFHQQKMINRPTTRGPAVYSELQQRVQQLPQQPSSLLSITPALAPLSYATPAADCQVAARQPVRIKTCDPSNWELLYLLAKANNVCIIPRQYLHVEEDTCIPRRRCLHNEAIPLQNEAMPKQGVKYWLCPLIKGCL